MKKKTPKLTYIAVDQVLVKVRKNYLDYKHFHLKSIGIDNEGTPHVLVGFTELGLETFSNDADLDVIYMDYKPLIKK